MALHQLDEPASLDPISDRVESLFVIPAKTGIQGNAVLPALDPACAGVTITGIGFDWTTL